jgi:hypothetical protein
MSNTILLPFQPDAMTPAQLAAVSYLARYSGHTTSCTPTSCAAGSPGVQQTSSIAGRNPKSARGTVHPPPRRGRSDAVLDQHDEHGVRGFFRFAHIDGLIPADPAVYARLPKIHQDETPHPGTGPARADPIPPDRPNRAPRALGYLLGINALRASEAAAVRIEDYTESRRGHRVLHLIGKGTSRPPCR